MPSPATSTASTVVDKTQRCHEHSTLYSGNRFTGTQRSGRSSYEVQVDFQTVDPSRGTLCGYLSIKGLTEDYPTLCTFFEGEIIGEHHSFLTRKWDANERIDREHWSRFPDFARYDKVFNSDGFVAPTDASVDFVYMRWKEIFLVPDHKVKTINGASFAGYYYVCYQRTTGAISGERYQKLELHHVPKNTFGVMEFAG